MIRELMIAKQLVKDGKETHHVHEEVHHQPKTQMCRCVSLLLVKRQVGLTSHEALTSPLEPYAQMMLYRSSDIDGAKSSKYCREGINLLFIFTIA